MSPGLTLPVRPSTVMVMVPPSVPGSGPATSTSTLFAFDERDWRTSESVKTWLTSWTAPTRFGRRS